MPDHKLIEKIKKEQKKQQEALLEKPGTVGVGVGLKESKGKITDELCLRIYVESKRDISDLLPEDLIPSEFILDDATKIKTDVIETGVLRPHAFAQKARPAGNGVGIGHFAVNNGTLGILATDNQSGSTVILSNNHILANLNNAVADDGIYQPAPFDGGTAADTIAHLVRFVPLDFVGINHVDAAIAIPLVPGDVSGIFLSPEIQNSDPVVGLLFAGGDTVTLHNHIDSVVSALDITLSRPTAQATLGMHLHKCGRTSEYTMGVVTDIDATVFINYAGVMVRFVNQIISTTMSLPGDSGAVSLHNVAGPPPPPPPPPTPTPDPATPDFSAMPVSGLVPLSVQFTDETVGTPLAYKWTFGDGQISTVQNPVHTYGSPGTYSVTLEVRTANGGQFTETKSNFISVADVTPVGHVPNAPTSLAAGVKSGKVQLSWKDKSNDEAGFSIERATGAGAFAEIASLGIGVVKYNDTTVSSGTTYSYRVRAFNANGFSGYSNTVMKKAK